MHPGSKSGRHGTCGAEDVVLRLLEEVLRN